ncbi:pirin family protein [Pseudoalteromonas sp. B137]
MDFFDHMGPTIFSAGSGINVRPHPHINLATVTYLFDGEILHRDSIGSKAIISPGDINLMIAGKGIVHSERESTEVRGIEHTLNGLQLWLALPEKFEEIEPAFYHYPSNDIPSLTIKGVVIRVLIGNAYGLKSPVKTYAETLYFEAHMQATQTLELENSEERAVYVVEGSIKIKDTIIEEHTMVILSQEDGVLIEAIGETRIALIGGEKMTNRFIDWNFISSKKERIDKAKKDWTEGRFPKVIDDEVDYIPYPRE